MPDDAASTRLFAAEALDDPRRRHRLEAAGFEDAAVAFVELYHPPADASGEVSVLVRDLETGVQHCFQVDTGDGDVAPCDG